MELWSLVVAVSDYAQMDDDVDDDSVVPPRAMASAAAVAKSGWAYVMTWWP